MTVRSVGSRATEQLRRGAAALRRLAVAVARRLPTAAHLVAQHVDRQDACLLVGGALMFAGAVRLQPEGGLLLCGALLWLLAVFGARR